MSESNNTLFSELFKYFGEVRQRKYENESTEKEIITQAAKEYREKVGIERYGDMSDIYILVPDVRNYIQKSSSISSDELKLILSVLRKIGVVTATPLHPYEMPIVFHFEKLLKEIEDKINNSENGVA